MATSQLIFVTGGSGYLGSHIVIQLLNKGYRVRAAARGAKVADLEKAYARFGAQFEVVSIPDLSNGQFPEVFGGVDAVIHTASPIAERQSPEETLKGAIEGTLNVIRQAAKGGVKRIVVTSSIVTAINPRGTFKNTDWNSVDKERALSDNALNTYVASKTLAELEVWDFADLHPDIDFTVLNPSVIYGPFAPGFSVAPGNYHALSTPLWIYRLLNPKGNFPLLPGYQDVRDVATAHVLALTSPPATEVGRKRIILSSPYGLNYGWLVNLIAEKRPALKDRLTRVPAPVFSDKNDIDFKRIEEVLGFKKEDYKGVEETVLEMIDNLIKVEKEWIAKGVMIDIPLESS